MKYKNFDLDLFQEKAIKLLNDDHSVIVSAPTGSGKTLIADYLINNAIGSDYRVVYTAPIKALSNQKYIEFSEQYGKSNVGLITGDTVINSLAQIVIMTTEIYRNMLLSKDPSVNDMKYVIFDEIHYMSDIERGTVWEESLIFSPKHIRFLCLSATIPNSEIFAKWISSIQGHKVEVVKHNKRSVPLELMLYHTESNHAEKLDKNNIKRLIAKKNQLQKQQITTKFKKTKKRVFEKDNVKYANAIRLIKYLDKNNMCPSIFFCFSRKQVEDYALNVHSKVDLLTKDEKSQIEKLLLERNFEERAHHYDIKHFDLVKDYILKGYGIHHAGLFPLIKEIVELLFSKGLIKVLFATETFAVGINMPAKTVVFNSLRKYDGLTFRSIQSQEFYQMAGRAGRRGIDVKGNVFVLYDDSTDLFALKRLLSKDSEPIISQFKLSYNTILNLVNNHDDREIEIILKSNFDYYQKKAEHNVRIISSYKSKLNNLIKLGYVVEAKELQTDEFYVGGTDNRSYALTDKGKFASKIYAHEITITELFFTGFYKRFNEIEINCLLSAIVYEPRKNDSFEIIKNLKTFYDSIVDKLKSNDLLYDKIDKKALYRLFSILYFWSDNSDFSEIVNLTNMQEGDIIRHIKQIIDFTRQIRRATNDFELSSFIDKARLLIDRDIVSITL